ncbi:MAG: type II secretion system protein [Candidatus Rokubacteria bacterium]|nr:type II secretion system protein [Candidatus Rokubacteria bacterium]
MRREGGFTLLEVLVALAILGLAVVTIIQLFSQGLRLLKVAGDYQQAVLLADQKAREMESIRQGIEAGQEGVFQWERSMTVTPVPEELTVLSPTPVRLYRVSVQVRWGGNRSVEIATLRTMREPLPQ